MQLRHARLCLNCEEVHSASHCPVCTSESFAYVSRWVPPGERRQVPRGPATPGAADRTASPLSAVQTPAPHMRWVKRGAAGVALFAASRLLWQMSRPVEWPATEVPHDDEAESGGDDFPTA